jgi:hypothetical protein
MRKNRKTATNSAIHASVKQEMSKPRTARSARIKALKLDTARIPEQPSTTMPGTVKKIIPASRPKRLEKGADRS